MRTYNLFKSRTFYTIVAMFVVGGANAISPLLSPPIQTVVMALLGVLGTVFHLDTAARGNVSN